MLETTITCIICVAEVTKTGGWSSVLKANLKFKRMQELVREQVGDKCGIFAFMLIEKQSKN